VKGLAGTSLGETDVYIIVKEHNKQLPTGAPYRLNTLRKNVYAPYAVLSS
jgi:hypothetical protein